MVYFRVFSLCLPYRTYWTFWLWPLISQELLWILLSCKKHLIKVYYIRSTYKKVFYTPYIFNKWLVCFNYVEFCVHWILCYTVFNLDITSRRYVFHSPSVFWKVLFFVLFWSGNILEKQKSQKMMTFLFSPEVFLSLTKSTKN